VNGQRILERARAIVGSRRYVAGDPDWEDRVQEAALALVARARGSRAADPVDVVRRLHSRQMKLEKSQLPITPRLLGEGRDDDD
jgi:hypothetical protein